MAKGRNTFSDKRPYKVYTALLTQTGTNAPTAIVLENTLGFEPTITYQNIGIYYVVISNIGNCLFFFNKQIQPPNDIIMVDLMDGETFEISSYVSSILSNNIINNMSMEIRVYN